jgi:methylmalonyl-CoA carboxyltransferase large subunit
MTPEPTDSHIGRLADSIEILRQEIVRLSERVAALEGHSAPTPGGEGRRNVAAEKRAASSASTAPRDERPEALSEEIVVVIGAAIAAFLGKKPHIRQIRLLGSAAWTQQGRVTIQASHALGPGEW